MASEVQREFGFPERAYDAWLQREQCKREIKDLEQRVKHLNEFMAGKMPEAGMEADGIRCVDKPRTSVKYKDYASAILDALVPASKFKLGVSMKGEFTSISHRNDYEEIKDNG